MLKRCMSFAVVGSVALVFVHEAAACGGGCGLFRRCCSTPSCTPCSAPASTVPPTAPSYAPEPPADVPPPVPTAMNGKSQYRSYSYDPQPATPAPVVRTYRPREVAPLNMFRADHKMRGL
jgi:hypothetical protein